MRIFKDLKPGTFDLHIHTTASDGIFSPTEVVHRAKEAGLSTIAITDHDTLAGVEEALAAGETSGVRVLSGVEISTRYGKKGVDILGYDIHRRRQLHETLSSLRDARQDRALGIIERFDRLGMPITLKEVQEFSGDGVITRPHIARAIVKKGYAEDVQTVFDRYLADGRPANVEKKVLTPQQGIQLIHQSGGQAVLAHPIYLGDDELVRSLLKFGFDGIEVWHRNHSPEDSQRYFQIAEELSLRVTGGSDFHTEAHRMGDFGAPTD
ncbi:PHP domain-containing protein [Paludifilum halophilum]|uniref:Phosphatase n=1 Tax=Paludifilum halophilum TaxID=1642702 RepID=A0A235BBI7_9BACL|nr:PHP domain-containing protein [Paludifilum halophilum]OYD08925.1 phosphatase [Paludifilum halophilum]